MKQGSYASVLDPAKTLFQVRNVRQDFEQSTDGLAITRVINLLNGIEPFIDMSRVGEQIFKRSSMPTHLISKSGLPSHSRNLRRPNFVLVLFKIPSKDPSNL